MKIFVTGATGFVGREVVRQLVSVGHKVSALVRDEERARSTLPASVELHSGDLSDQESLEKGAAGSQALVHLIGIIVESRRQTFESVHVEGTRRMVRIAKELGIRRFIYMSALGTRPEARSRYHRTKYLAEQAVRESGLDWTIFRPSVIFGPEDRFTNRLATIIRRSPIVPIIGPGTSRLQPISVSDVAACVALSVGNLISVGKIYELGGPKVLTMKEVYESIMEALEIEKRTVHLPVDWIKPAVRLIERILPAPPLTSEQLIMLEEDNLGDSQPAITDFRLELQGFREGIEEYLKP